ncbi:MAG: CDP-diacylglycerol--glycerol-3-phosphate 3-phosphatidyltransferase [Actinomycetota bacterium]|jgi:CDP-diacylglycerol--glycerol-3-phosphate 3-phosphatidyltransferase
MNSKSFLYRQTPNLITTARIALVPIVLWLILGFWESDLGRVTALVLLVLAASTDGIDGAIARKRNLVTNLGKLLDPIADKALLSGSLIALSIIGQVQWWITVAILLRELGITVYRLVVAKRKVIAASSGGKFKTVLQIIAISLAIAPFDFLGSWYQIFVYLVLLFTVVITWYTGISYLRPRK